MYKYEVKFDFEGSQQWTYADSLIDLKDGFWINESNHFSRNNDNVVWIPPSRIIFIRKTLKD